MSGFAASRAQRDKIRGEPCINCTQPADDPAHVCARAQGGCDDPDCVVPLCRRCHTLYDTGKLDLLPALEPRHRRELGHAVTHLGLIGTVRRVTNAREAA